MSKKCSKAGCDRSSFAQCRGCELDFCREHMIQHSNSTHLELNPLIIAVNEVSKQLVTVNLKTLFASRYNQLKDWRVKAHELIDKYFEEKLHELDVFLEEKHQCIRNDYDKVHTTIKSMIEEQETTHEKINFAKFKVENLVKDLQKFKNCDYKFQMNPLTFDDNLIRFDESLHISTLPPVYKTVERNDDSFTPIAADNQFLLLHQNGALAIVDENLSTFKKTSWTHGPIYDMCYSSTLQRFIIITENQVFLLNKETMMIVKVRSIPWQQWFCCTCSDVSLYLSTKVYNSSLIQFNLLPSIAYFKRWSSSDICSDDEAIDGMAYNNNKLALMISNDVKRTLRFDLRSSTTLERIWSLSPEITYSEVQAFRFCPYGLDEWFIADHNDSRILHIGADGKMKSALSYEPTPCCLIVFGHSIIAVSTKEAVRLHKLL